jgi:hypothetical protein
MQRPTIHAALIRTDCRERIRVNAAVFALTSLGTLALS